MEHNPSTNPARRHNPDKVVMTPTHLAMMTPAQANAYLGISSTDNALKVSRSNGKLWGIAAPRFVKAGVRKVLYRTSDLDFFLQQFQTYGSNAEMYADPALHERFHGQEVVEA